MVRVLRAVSLLNAIYLGAVGLVALFSPGVCAALFHIGIPDNMEAAILRLLGALLVCYAGLLWRVSRLGPDLPVLAPLALAFSVINLFADLVAVLADSAPAGNLAPAMVCHGVLAVLLLAWLREQRQQGTRAPQGEAAKADKRVTTSAAGQPRQLSL